jgi:hypothetical protein
MQTPVQAAGHEHACSKADIELIRGMVLEGKTEACDGQVHAKELARVRDATDDPHPPYVFFGVSRGGMDRFYKVFFAVEPSDVSPAITMPGTDPRHQHGG